jgi:hypothetical protein
LQDLKTLANAVVYIENVRFILDVMTINDTTCHPSG